ncbi:hypothetical protein [Oceanicoccus sagamiensis]|uniref:hypothetical protein n=1 Tax=Oceanicoccus sagamiensis TaxID=716816 RepID=UPI0012F4B667|nr:hypothetical protein [Oceanicoccus sagamiensis]
MDKQAPPFSESLPIDPLVISANYFSLDCLEFSFHCLREEYPSLALAVQNLLVESRLQHENNSREKLIELELDVQTVSDIVTALSEVAEHAALTEGHSKEEMIAIHQTLLDWLLYAQSFLDTINPLAMGIEGNQGEEGLN